MLNRTTYLAGAMQGTTREDARRWRIELTKKLANIDIDTLDPTDPEFQKKNYSYDAEELANHPDTVRSFENLDFVRAVRKLAYVDLHAVASCDFVTFYWSKACMKGAGSYGEATLAYWLHKPLYTLIARNDVEIVPGWIMGITDKVFYNPESYLKYVQENHKPEREYYIMPFSGGDVNTPPIMQKRKGEYGFGKSVDFQDPNFMEALAEALELDQEEEGFSQAYANYAIGWHKMQKQREEWNARYAWQVAHEGDSTPEIPFDEIIPSSLDMGVR